MKIYTKQGDDGNTGIWGGARISKDDCRIESYGCLDELSAVLGIVRSNDGLADDISELLRTLQNQLFNIGSELAAEDPTSLPVPPTGQEEVAGLESAIDRFDATLEPLRAFILPGGTPAAAALHLARTICRRAERRVVSLSKVATINPTIVSYLNRLSDLLFVLARAVNASSDVHDIQWTK